jgi:hypothetical protein
MCYSCFDRQAAAVIEVLIRQAEFFYLIKKRGSAAAPAAGMALIDQARSRRLDQGVDVDNASVAVDLDPAEIDDKAVHS